MDFRRPIPLDRFSQYFPPSCQPRRESAIVSATSMRAQSLTLSLALLLAPALAQTPAPQTGNQPAPAAAQPAQPQPAPRPNDHQHMMDLLHITALRPGVAQNGSGPNPVNWDESKANPWPNLPNPLVLNNGKPVNSAKHLDHQAPSRAGRALRPRDPWPRSRQRPRRPLGGRLHHPRLRGRNPHHHQAPHRPRRQLRLPGHHRRHRSRPHPPRRRNQARPRRRRDSPSTARSAPLPAAAPRAPCPARSAAPPRPGACTRPISGSSAAPAGPCQTADPRQGLGLTCCSIPPPTRQTAVADSPPESSASATTASFASWTTGAHCAPGPGGHRAWSITFRLIPPSTPTISPSRATPASARPPWSPWPTNRATPSPTSTPLARVAPRSHAAALASSMKTSPRWRGPLDGRQLY